MIQGFIELPSPLQLAIVSAITFLVGFVFAKIAEAVPWLGGFLGEYADEVAMALSGAVVSAVQNWLNAVPAGYEGIVAAVLQVIVAALSALGLFRLFGKAGVRGFK